MKDTELGSGSTAEETRTPEALFLARYDGLTRAATLVTGDVDAARDCVQEAFLRLCRDWDKVKDYEHLELWVRQVTINLARDHRRARLRGMFLTSRLSELPTDEPDSRGEDGLWKTVRSLPPRQRLAIGLYYLADLRISEISTTMGISEGAVKKHLDRARNSLRRNLEVST